MRMLQGQIESEGEMKLLIVEDNPKTRRFLREMLADLATTIYECSDGAQAVAAYEAHAPDWVLMDIRMKEVDGIVATRQIKERWPAAQIMIVTDYDNDALREAAKEAGAREYVLKESLIAVRRILTRAVGAKS